MSHAKRVIAVLLAFSAPAGPVAGGGGDGSESSSNSITEVTNAVPTIVVKNGEPVGGVQELEYSAGDEIRFRVSSNQADEVHVHGYDVEEEIPAGGSARLAFPADIEGIFEVELHGSETQIAELRVNP
jgi:hypothetical protein